MFVVGVLVDDSEQPVELMIECQSISTLWCCARAAGYAPMGEKEIDLSSVSAAQVLGHPDQLSRAVRNLSDNAVRHAHATIAFTVAELDGHAILSVTDDGPGVAPDQHTQIFERFARADTARSSQDGGAALGLAITKAIIESHGGTLAIDPQHAPGARFVITIPLSPTPTT